MITRLKRKDTGAGTKRLVFRKASGADTIAPITVPIKAMENEPSSLQDSDIRVEWYSVEHVFYILFIFLEQLGFFLMKLGFC